MKREALQAIVLAAGAGRRLGQDKASMVLDGQRALDRILGLIEGAGLPPSLVVIGAHAPVQKQKSWGAALRFVENPDWAQGRSSSITAALRASLEAVPPPKAWLMWPVDVALITGEILEQLISAWEASEPETCLIIPSYEQRRGHPIIFNRDFAQKLLALGANESPRPLFRALPEGSLLHVEVSSPVVLMDIDEPDDLERARRFLAGDGAGEK